MTLLDGHLLLPGDAEYARLRRPFVGGDREELPSAAVACRSEADVSRALAMTTAQRVPFAIRSGGHCCADASSTTGLLIDLGDLRSIGLAGDLVTVGPGARLGEVQRTLAERGRCLPAGSCASVAVGGNTLSGGFGFLGRRYGLTADNLVAARVVLADGSCVRVGEGGEPDLDWALRGGGTLGVVTELVLRTHPLPPVTAFHASWPVPPGRRGAAGAVAVIDRWQRWATAQPDDITAHLCLTVGGDPTEPAELAVFGCVLREGGIRLDGFPPADLRTRTLYGTAAAEHLAGVRGRAGEERAEPSRLRSCPGFRRVTSSFFARPVPTAALGALIDVLVGSRVPGERREVEFIPWGGAYSAVPPDATAFVHRRASFLAATRATLDPSASPELRDQSRRWVRACADTLAPYGTGGAYQGYADPFLPEADRAYYGTNLERLQRVRADYDPCAVFGFADHADRHGGFSREG